MTRLAVILLVLAAVWPCASSAAGTMRCRGGIVSEGMSAAAVLAACGEPAYRDAWNEDAYGRGLLGDAEEWYYNFGANQLLRVLHLRNGTVGDIATDGYGYDQPPSPPCAPADIVEGMSKYRLALLCGTPLTRRVQTLIVPYDRYGRHGYDARGYSTTVYREEWTYNFGSAYLMRLVVLENGRVTDVQNTERGFD
ncbi:MAG: DUF2845 domain-containing protein [Nevskiaceae bacterium]|nr:MAG: DUF2845 domain-containing protein [Nevskiaceae bacterium]